MTTKTAAPRGFAALAWRNSPEGWATYVGTKVDPKTQPEESPYDRPHRAGRAAARQARGGRPR